MFVGTHPVALIDWDFAAPAPRAWDIAYALWRFVALYGDPVFGTPAQRARRIRLFCDACRGGFVRRNVALSVIPLLEK